MIVHNTHTHTHSSMYKDICESLRCVYSSNMCHMYVKAQRGTTEKGIHEGYPLCMDTRTLLHVRHSLHRSIACTSLLDPLSSA